ncbi:GTPase Era, mitochondrial-like isoform X2 [Temnothorax curvispinosus]|uniref:GTPase Era, mitochondrial n=1 Tax=Temnothorax curvispinosus TaxID=300111 RepID=A0A6J1RHU0_9HYME|nr:GTPase Era, mitochondrial-like isoform X2 [Temnothorax curvispinosus]
MLFTIERYVIRASARCLQRCFSNSVDVSAREFVLQPNESPTSIRAEAQKCLKIAFLGAPNVGKSTIVNQLIKRSVCPVSCKVHTTQAKARAIYCEGDTQLIFLDTPGMVSTKESKKFKLDSSFKTDPKTSLQAADIVGIVQDAENVYTRHKIDTNILELLTEDIRSKIPIILVINKVDRLKKKEILLDLIHTLTKSKKSPDFYDVFMISALTGDGINDLRTYLLDTAKPRAWEYERHIYSDNTCEDIIRQTVRAKLMDILPNEVPYRLQVKLEHFDPAPDDSIKALVSVTCPNKRIARLLMRGSNNRIGQTAVIAEEALRHAFRTSVRLKISVQSPS